VEYSGGIVNVIPLTPASDSLGPTVSGVLPAGRCSSSTHGPRMTPRPRVLDSMREAGLSIFPRHVHITAYDGRANADTTRQPHCGCRTSMNRLGGLVSLFFTNGGEPIAPDASSPEVQRKGRPWLALSLAAIALVLVGALFAGVLYAVSIDRAVNESLRHSGNQLPAETPTAKGEKSRPAKGTGKAINYVLMGSDSRDVGDAGHGRSDVLMVMHLAGDRKSAYMISFPRDMYVQIPGYGKNKINAAFAFGGPALTVRTLEGLLNTRMDHVVLIDFEGFINLTEELGGVTVYNRYPSLSRGYKFPVGDVTLRGEQALAYVRERHQLPHGDLDRAERQRVVLRAVLAKGLAKETITNPAKFVSFVRGVSRHVTVDDQLTETKLRKTAMSLRLTPRDIRSLQAPISGFGTSPTKQSIDIVDKKKLKELAKALQNDRMDAYLDKYPKS
jgi:polyisoprenyl-teichoic acid--peptidoglycan teichoic acid transferase